MVLGMRYQDDEGDEAPRGLLIRWGMLGRIVKVGLGVGAFSVIAGSILADSTTERGTGASKVAWFLSPTDRDAMRRTATAALTGDIATGSIKLDPCALPKK
ncbi:hypothetical protein SAMN05444161_4765 [Rhizobiales bacterium GAS191]|jgi:hypothetical protein|nr:hypothetical protein SAMN05519103_04042 [Rhizobiales bacterium GAS113]SEE06666.1 hypothetical protein SAMN05444161_4765 [Rhizobiales bacterium GAS191]